MSDIFFRAAHPLSPSTEKLWKFVEYLADIVIVNMGTIDAISLYFCPASIYNKTPEAKKYAMSTSQKSALFIKSYVEFIYNLRQKGYPRAPIVLMSPVGGLFSSEAKAVYGIVKTRFVNIYWVDINKWLNSSHFEENGILLNSQGHVMVANALEPLIGGFREFKILKDNYTGDVEFPMDTNKSIVTSIGKDKYTHAKVSTDKQEHYDHQVDNYEYKIDDYDEYYNEDDD